jgi:RNA polymerase sigma factor (sigma-70 family)
MALVEEDLNDLLLKSRAGDRTALDALVGALSRPIYNVAIRMLWSPEDAEDASQEILIKVVTNLAAFRGRSLFTTWVYRLAVNYLKTYISTRKMERRRFEEQARGLAEGLGHVRPAERQGVDEALLAEEMKIGCVNGMLQCLDVNARVAYIIGDILGLSGREAAAVQGIAEEACRKRLSRARRELFAFMDANCGLVNPSRPCRCAKQIDHCVTSGKIRPRRLLFAVDGRGLELLERLDSAEKVLRLYRPNPEYDLPAPAIDELKRILHGEGRRSAG